MQFENVDCFFLTIYVQWNNKTKLRHPPFNPGGQQLGFQHSLEQVWLWNLFDFHGSTQFISDMDQQWSDNIYIPGNEQTCMNLLNLHLPKSTLVKQTKARSSEMNEAPPRLQYLRTNLTDSVSSKSDRNLWRPKSVKGKKREYGQIQVRWHKKKRLKLLELSPVAMFEFLNMILKPLSQTLNKSDKWWSQTLMVLYFDGKEWLGMQ